MIKELYRIEVQETSLNVTQGRVDSVRRKNIVKSGCRVYEDGCVGIAGTLGEADEETWAQAIGNLSRKIPYPYPVEQNRTRAEDRREEVLDSKEFTRRVELLLDRLRAAFPRITFSNKVNMTQETVTLQNDAGLELKSCDLSYEFALLAKDVDSVAIIDTAACWQGRTLDVDALFADFSQVLTAHGARAALPEQERIPLILDMGECAGLLAKALHGQMFYRGASLLSGKVGEQVFSPDFTLYVDRSADACRCSFFDAEGVTLPQDRCVLVENGVLLRAYADKKTASEFSVDSTAAADGRYDDAPQLGVPNLQVASGDKTLRELLAGREAIYVLMMDGGDCTDEGIFSSPVQVSYLYRDGKLVGKLPEFSVSGSIFDIFGKNYLGRTADKPFGGISYLVSEVTVSR